MSGVYQLPRARSWRLEHRSARDRRKLVRACRKFAGLLVQSGGPDLRELDDDALVAIVMDGMARLSTAVSRAGVSADQAAASFAAVARALGQREDPLS